MRISTLILPAVALAALPRPGVAEKPLGLDAKQSLVYARLKAAIDAVPAIDTHAHLFSLPRLRADVAKRGEEISLQTLWSRSYLSWICPIPSRPKDQSFDQWWARAETAFDDVRSTSFYRYMLPAIRDLYGTDWDTVTLEQAREADRRVRQNYQNDQWPAEVLRRAGVERVFVDPWWARFEFERPYPFVVIVLNVSSLGVGTHPSAYTSGMYANTQYDSPYAFAEKAGLKVGSLDDYLAVIEAIFCEAVRQGAVCAKTTIAYRRTLLIEDVPRQRAAAAWGKPPAQLTPAEQKDFEDYIYRQVAVLCAKHHLPIQIHTGDACLRGSNPILLADLIQANPKTKFVLFHGGYPWVGETGVIALRHKNVWIDSCWLPQLNYTMAKRAYQEWLDGVPSDRILWGSDVNTAEGLYGAAAWTRQCLAEALAEKVLRNELREEHAIRIGCQVMRDNALKLFGQLPTPGSP